MEFDTILIDTCMYLTLYSYNNKESFECVVDKVLLTRKQIKNSRF